MPGFSFSKAKNLGLLSQKEIERFAIMYLAMFDEVKVDCYLSRSRLCEKLMIA